MPFNVKGPGKFISNVLNAGREASFHTGSSASLPPLPRGWREESVDSESGTQPQYVHVLSGQVQNERPGPLPTGWKEVVEESKHPMLGMQKALYYQYRDAPHRQLGRPSPHLPSDWVEGCERDKNGDKDKDTYYLYNRKTNMYLYERPSSEEGFLIQSQTHDELMAALEQRDEKFNEKVRRSTKPEQKAIALTHLDELEEYLGFFKESGQRVTENAETPETPVSEETHPWPIKGVEREKWLGEQISTWHPAQKNYTNNITIEAGLIAEFKVHENKPLMAAAARYVYDRSIANRSRSPERELSSEERRQVRCLQEYIAAVCRRTQLSGLSLLHVLNYFEKSQSEIKAKQPRAGANINAMARMFLASMMTGNKMSNDDGYSNASWREVHDFGCMAARGFVIGGNGANRHQPLIQGASQKDINQIERELLRYSGFSGNAMILQPEQIPQPEMEAIREEMAATQAEGAAEWKYWPLPEGEEEDGQEVKPHALSPSTNLELKSKVDALRSLIEGSHP